MGAGPGGKPSTSVVSWQPPAYGGGKSAMGTMDNLTRSADELYANILNLTRPAGQLRQQFEKLLTLREQIGSAGKGGKMTPQVQPQGPSSRIAPSEKGGKGGKVTRPTPAGYQ